MLPLFLYCLCHFLNAYPIMVFMLKLTKKYTIANITYILWIYGLPILFFLVGFYLIYRYEYHEHFSIKNIAITRKLFLFWLTMLLFTILFSIVKFLITEVDKELSIDFIIISLTSSFLVAIYATFLFYFYIQKNKPI
jgi:hypothetical protein